MLGSSSVLTELPKKRSALSRSLCLPTIVRRSPYCKRRSSLASNLTSPRITRLTLIPYATRRCRLPSFFPLRPFRVIIHIRLSTFESIWFQSTSFLFQSFSTFWPKRSSIASSSSFAVTTRSESFSLIIVLARGTITCFPRHILEMINLMCVI